MHEKIKSILYYILIFVLTAVLVGLLLVDHQRSARVAEENEKSALEQGAETKRLRAAGEKIYDQLTDSLENALKGFVLWGDAQALDGKSGRVVLTLSSKMEDAFFSQIMEDFSNIGRMYNVSDIMIDVENMSVSNESLNEIMVRTGAHGLLVGEDFEMPSDTTPLNIVLTDGAGKDLLFAEQTYAKFGESWINGVAGKFYAGDHTDSLHFHLAFQRTTEGQRFTVPAGTPVETTSAKQYRSHCPILCFPEYDSITSDDFIAYMREIIALYGDQAHYILICVTEEGSEWDQALLQAFGSRYILYEKPADGITDSDCDALAAHIFSVLSSHGAFDAVQEAVSEAHEKLLELSVEN